VSAELDLDAEAASWKSGQRELEESFQKEIFGGKLILSVDTYLLWMTLLPLF
jgi:hypothetical protein